MVGSTVYGFEDQLSQIVAQLTTLGYEVISSHYGTIKELKKPYWFLVHRDVIFARQLLKKMKLKSGDEIIISDNKFFDKRSIEVYEFVIRNHVPVTLRNGNWAQEFYRLDEAMIYINAQFEDKVFINRVLSQNT